MDAWISASQQGAPTVAGFMYVTLASLAAGVTVSAVRWAIIDHLHHATGVVPPAWKFANLEGKLTGVSDADRESLPLLPVLLQHVHRRRVFLFGKMRWTTNRSATDSGRLPGS